MAPQIRGALSVPDPQHEDDSDSLFGEGVSDDVDSLFGDSDDGPSSHFTEETDASTPATVEKANDSESASLTLHSGPPQQASNRAPQLHFPSRPSDAVPTRGRAKANAAYTLCLPTVPDPPAALLLTRDGHTSGDSVVSSQNVHNNSEETGGAGYQAHVDAAWAASVFDDQTVDTSSQATPTEAARTEGTLPDIIDVDSLPDPTPEWLTAAEIPGYRYAECNTAKDLRIPARIDKCPDMVPSLAAYLTLRRSGIKLDELYKSLELDHKSGKSLNTEIKTCIATSPFAEPLLHEKKSDILDTKVTLVNAAFYLLNSSGLGSRYFGPCCDTARNRSMFWPANSTLLFYHFVALVERVVRNTRQTFAQRGLRPADRVTMAKPTPSPTPSKSPSMSPPITFGTAGSTVTVPQAVENSRPPLDSLVVNATRNKRRRCELEPPTAYEVEVPENARLTYHIYIRDRQDGRHLADPFVCRHTDGFINEGAHTYLDTALRNQGWTPHFFITTPLGVRSIHSELEWGAAVVQIYNNRRYGAQVEVDIWV